MERAWVAHVRPDLRMTRQPQKKEKNKQKACCEAARAECASATVHLATAALAATFSAPKNVTASRTKSRVRFTMLPHAVRASVKRW